MNRPGSIVTALAVACAFLAFSVTPAWAAPKPPDVLQTNVCSGGSSCSFEETITGTGQDLLIMQGNKCSGATTLCSTDVTLVGDFGTVVILRSNNCTDGATCSNNVAIDGTVQHLIIRPQTFVFDQFRFVNHCDQSATCSNSPNPPPV